jgi:hypothetical protein
MTAPPLRLALRTTLAATGALSLAACRMTDVAAPGVDGDARRVAVTLPPGLSIEVPTSPESFQLPTVVVLTPGIAAFLRVSGVVELTNTDCNPATTRAYYDGIRNGSSGDAGEVRWRWMETTDTSWWSTSQFTSTDDSHTAGVSVVDSWVAGAAQLTVWRTGIVGDDCESITSPGTWRQRTVSGSQTVTVDFWALTVQASTSDVPQGQAVDFVLTSDGYTIQPGDAIGWEYYLNDCAPGGSCGYKVDVTACAGQMTCRYAPTVPGLMVAYVGVVFGPGRQGSATSAGARLSVINACLTGDPLVDNAAMRALMKAAWDSSNAFDLILANRRERGGILYDTGNGNFEYRTYFAPTDTPCRSFLIPTGPLPGTPVAVFHTHPWTHGDETTGVCSSAVPGVKSTYDAQKYGGPSRGDILRSDAEHDNLPQVAMDKQNIYVVPAGTVADLTAKYRVKSYPRQGNGCTRP